MPSLQRGEIAPNFALPDQNGNQWILSDRLAGGPLVLLFYRGDW